ncbi:MAG: S4 domain-containing protein, partial [Myxococcota bacterium]|nr:S4 domain-containing protein [Myxococcota bacterium]
ALEAQKAAQAVFQSGGVSANMPTYAADLPAKLVDLLSDSGLAKSKSAARRLITGGAVKLDFGDGKTPVKDIDAELSLEAVLWAGKKSCVRITAQ